MAVTGPKLVNRFALFFPGDGEMSPEDVSAELKIVKEAIEKVNDTQKRFRDSAKPEIGFASSCVDAIDKVVQGHSVSTEEAVDKARQQYESELPPSVEEKSSERKRRADDETKQRVKRRRLQQEQGKSGISEEALDDLFGPGGPSGSR